MYKREKRSFHDRSRDRERIESTEHFYGSGFVTHGLREPLPRRYDERHYPRDYERDRRGRR